MRLRDHERALIARRRLGWSQLQMARAMGLRPRQYVLFEAGKPSCCSRGWLRAHGVDIGRVGKLRTYERCVIMRRRSGKTQAQVARELGCSRRWVTLMELGRAPCDDLTWYWEQ